MFAQFRLTYQRLVMPLGHAALKLGLGPDFWTVLSVLLSIAAAYVLSQQNWVLGLAVVFTANFLDLVDGATARAGGTANPFGTVFDHNMDRYAEFIIFGGILLSGYVPAWLIYTALFGMVMASYVRAKAESAGGLEHCVVGLAGRAEKLLLLYLGLALEGFFGVGGALYWVIAIIALISHITFLQRLLYTRRQLRTGAAHIGHASG